MNGAHEDRRTPKDTSVPPPVPRVLLEPTVREEPDPSGTGGARHAVAERAMADELLPTPEAREATRRNAVFVRWGRVGGGAVGLLVAVGVSVILVLSGGSGSGIASTTARVAGKDQAKVTTTSRVGTSTTSTDGGEIARPSTDPSTGRSGASAEAPPGTAPGGGGGTAPGVFTNPASLVTVSQTPASCRYDPDSFDLFVEGTATNSSSQNVTAEFDIVWQDDTGELDSWSDLVNIAPNGTESWSETGSASDPPVGALRCIVTLVG